MGKEFIYQISAVLGVNFTASYIVIGSSTFLILEKSFLFFVSFFSFVDDWWSYLWRLKKKRKHLLRMVSFVSNLLE